MFYNANSSIRIAIIRLQLIQSDRILVQNRYSINLLKPDRYTMHDYKKYRDYR